MPDAARIGFNLDWEQDGEARDRRIPRMDAREWRRWERLINERGVVIDRLRGHAHPLYPDMIYPCDYGHVPKTRATDGEEVDVFVGPVSPGLVGLVALTHQPSGISEPKLLMNLSRADAAEIVKFLDRGDPRPDLHLVWRDAAPYRAVRVARAGAKLGAAGWRCRRRVVSALRMSVRAGRRAFVGRLSPWAWLCGEELRGHDAG